MNYHTSFDHKFVDNICLDGLHIIFVKYYVECFSLIGYQFQFSTIHLDVKNTHLR